MRNLALRNVTGARAGLKPDSQTVQGCYKVSGHDGAYVHWFITEDACDGFQLQTVVAHSHPLHHSAVRNPWESSDLNEFLASPSDRPISLSVDPSGLDPAVIAFKEGSLVTVDVETGLAELAGEVTDEVDASQSPKSSLLGVQRSPDGALLAIVSSHKVMCMTLTWDVVGELDHGGLAVAADISWCGDGEAFALSLLRQNGTVEGRVVERDMSSAIAIDSAYVDASVPAEDGYFLARNLCPPVAWQPRAGGVICLGGPGMRVSCYERNGLRHMRNDFALSGSMQGSCDQAGADPAVHSAVRSLQWSACSTFLAVLTEHEGSELSSPSERQSLEVYVRSNYKWYLKTSIRLPHSVIGYEWDGESARVLHVFFSSGMGMSYAFDAKYDVANEASMKHTYVGVVDGCSVHVTDFSRAIIPPPMCHTVVSASAPITGLALCRDHPRLGCLLVSNEIEVLEIPLPGAKLRMKGEAAGNPLRRFSWLLKPGLSALGDVMCLRAPMWLNDELLLLVEDDPASSGSSTLALLALRSTSNVAEKIATLPFQSRISSLATGLASSSRWEIIVASDVVRIVSVNTGDGTQNPSLQVQRELPSVKASAIVRMEYYAAESGSARLVSLDRSGRLNVVAVDERKDVELSTDCTSFCTLAGFLIFTTRSHLLYTVPMESGALDVGAAALEDQLRTVSENFSKLHLAETPSDHTCGAIRPIDRGSTIVAGLHGDVRVVLQAPRGNLETVAPRPVVLRRVHSLAKAREYRDAFLLSRRQRIDMNILVDADFDGFLESLPVFVDQVREPNHLCVFLTLLSQPTDKLNQVCCAIVDTLRQNREEKCTRMTSVVLTALTKHSPAKTCDALEEVRRSRSVSPEEGASALDFLHVLLKDEELLYNEALGMYDLSLAAMVAKASVMDPADYSGELRMLNSMDELRMRFTIDEKLGRYSSALTHLWGIGESERDACIRFAKEHALHAQALSLFVSNARATQELRESYAERLDETHRYKQAAVVWLEAGLYERAANSYREAGMWRLAMSAMLKAQETSKSAVLPEFIESVCEHLVGSGREAEAATVQWEFRNDLQSALDLLVSIQEWSRGFELISASRVEGTRNVDQLKASAAAFRDDLIEAANSHVTDLADTLRKLRDRSARLVAVREAKASMKAALGTPGLSNRSDGNFEADSDAFSESTGQSSVSSSASSAYSDMTFASSTAAKSSRTSLYSSVGRGNSSRGRAAAARKASKAARKRVRPGDPREEEALVVVVCRLVPNGFLRARIGRTIEALVLCGESRMALNVHNALMDTLNACGKLPNDIVEREEVKSATSDETWKIDILAELFPQPEPNPEVN